MVEAVLVDGVRRTKAYRVEASLNIVRIPRWRPFSVLYEPVPAAPSRIDVSDFRCVGELPDRRRVFCYQFERGPQYRLWRVDAAWADELPEEAKKEVYRDIERRIADLGVESVRLYDETVSQGCTHHRTVMGVARG